jgi:carbohydrate-selective porin OprB
MSGKVSPHLAGRQRLEQELGSAIAVQRSETSIELNYDVAFAKWLAVMPGVQHIIHPAADPARHDVTVIGPKAVLKL